MTGPSKLGLGADARARLIGRLGARPVATPEAPPEAPPERAQLGDPLVRGEIEVGHQIGTALGLSNPYFRQYAGRGDAVAEVDGRQVRNFASYDYLGLNRDPRVGEAAKAAIDRYGTSVSGSRLTSGQRQVHRDLEAALAAVYEVEACVTFISGHATNVTVIAHLVGAEDAVIYDALSHNSIVQGALMSGARRRSFAHNDLDDLERALRETTRVARRTLVVIEGLYSMDGDVPDLPRLASLTRRYGAWLMVDEAHALGVLGPRGFGVADHFGMDPNLIDIWMGTLSKALSSCGGYIAGSSDIVEYLRGTAPGFLYSVGMPGPVAAAAAQSLAILRAEPERVARLQANGRLFIDACNAEGLNTAAAVGAAICPVIIGSALKTSTMAHRLWLAGVQVFPIYYPGVPERTARLRFFVTAEHDPAGLQTLAAEIADIGRAVEIDPTVMLAAAGRAGFL